MSSSNKGAAVSKAGKKVSVSMVVAIVALVAVLLLAVALVYVLTKKDVEAGPESGGRGTIITEDNVDDVINSMNEGITDATYTVTMTNRWVFEDGQAAAENFYVKNDEINKRTVYFDLILSGTDEVIYSSPYIPVGEEMDTIILDKDLDAGDYNVIMVYHLVDDDRAELTTVSVAVVIHINN